LKETRISPRINEVLPIVLPPQEDELISSWLDRIGRFYNAPIEILLKAYTGSRDFKDISRLDLGKSRAPLVSVAMLLGISVERLANQTLKSKLPKALKRSVAYVPLEHQGRGATELRYAACSICLEQQKIDKGFSWLRRDWVIATRTVCQIHYVRLLETGRRNNTHPVWSTYFEKHAYANQSFFSTSCFAQESITSSDTEIAKDEFEYLHRFMASIQDDIPLNGDGNRSRRRGRCKPALMIGDVIWAFTRSDRRFENRLVYEDFAIMENKWHVIRRRRPGPVDYSALSLEVRYRMQATAAMFVGFPMGGEEPQEPTNRSQQALAESLRNRLTDADQSKFRMLMD
jgi:hypothetical protein